MLYNFPNFSDDELKELAFETAKYGLKDQRIIHLNQSQRAFLVKRMAKLLDWPSVKVNRIFQVNKDSTYRVGYIQKYCTNEQIKQIKNGEISIHTVYSHLRKHKNKERKHSNISYGNKINTEIYNHLHEAFIHLSNIPCPKDVVAIVRHRSNSSRDFINLHLSSATSWIKEFENEWNKHD